jgi:hypothetical protein
VTQATLDAGTVGAYIAPQPVQGQKPEVPPVPPPPTPGPCPCGSKDEIAGLFEAVANLIALVEQLARQQDHQHTALVRHIDDAKARIERVSQELANKPEAACRLPKWR